MEILIKHVSRLSRTIGTGVLLSILALIVATPVYSADATATRQLPATASPGQTIQVRITFTAPADQMNAIGVKDVAPAGWTVATDPSWCSPAASFSNSVNSGSINRAEYVWSGPYAASTAFNAVYQVNVPPSATPGNYSFGNSKLEYYIGPPPGIIVYIGGTATVTIPGAATTTPTPTPTSAPPPAGGGGGGGAAIQPAQQVRSPDGKVSINIAANTMMLDARGVPVYSLSATPVSSPPSPPTRQGVVSAYNCGPDGATFSPPITLTLAYNPSALASGASESNLYLAWWNGSEWLALQSSVDTANKTVSAPVSHFTSFAVLVRLPEPPSFIISPITLVPLQVKPGDPITISSNVSNTGGSSGVYTAILRIGNIEEARKDVTLSPGASQSVSFTVSKTAPGSYSVDLGGSTGQFTVTGAAVSSVSPAPKITTPSPAPKPSSSATVAVNTPQAVLPSPVASTPAATPAPPGPTAPTHSPMNWAIIGPAAGVVVIVLAWLLIRFRARKK